MAKKHQTIVTPGAGGAGAAAARAVDPVAEAARAIVPAAETVALGSAPEREQIAQLAYSYWQARGCPEGSPEEDWLRADAELRKRAAGTRA